MADMSGFTLQDFYLDIIDTKNQNKKQNVHREHSKSLSEEKHQDQPKWNFEFSEEIKLKASEEEQREWDLATADYEASPSCPSDTELTKKDVTTGKTCSVPVDQKTPHSTKRTTSKKKARRRKSKSCLSPLEDRYTPIPLLSWADSKEVWQNMIFKEEATLNNRNPTVFGDRTSYLPRMRAILLDWIMEVCEVYRLRRATYHLAVDFLDRYLSLKPNVPKTQLQLLGVSCLFIAAKMEEIYPPKLSEFSYVCDGACTDDQILSCEILLLNTLGWDVNPMTPSGWLNLYMQIHYNADNVRKQRMHEGINYNFQFPQYSAHKFIKASHIIDLFSMDPGYLRFSYSIISAGAMYFIFGKQVALLVSGLTWERLEPCITYMSIFNEVISESTDPRLTSLNQQDPDERQLASFRSIKDNIPNVVEDESHCMQTHVIDLEFYEKAVVLRLENLGYNFPKEKKADSPTAEDSLTDSAIDLQCSSSPPTNTQSEASEELESILSALNSPNYLDSEIDAALYDSPLELITITPPTNDKSKITYDDILAKISDIGETVTNKSPYWETNAVCED